MYKYVFLGLLIFRRRREREKKPRTPSFAQTLLKFLRKPPILLPIHQLFPVSLPLLFPIFPSGCNLDASNPPVPLRRLVNNRWFRLEGLIRRDNLTA